MKIRRERVRTAAVLVALATLPALAAPQIEQSIELQPGWNAVWLEVQPEPNDPGTLFGGLPIESVWTWQPRTSSVEFIQDPSEGLLNRPGWLGYFPPGPAEFLTNLHAIGAHRAYLVKLHDQATPVTLVVNGRPSLRSINWSANSYNLVGFPVDPEREPSFGDFLATSAAHDSRPIYRLDADGRWHALANLHAETIRSGEAYWVFSDGASSFNAPIEVATSFGTDGLDFGATRSELRLRIRDRTGERSGVLIRRLASTAALPLCSWRMEDVTDPDSGQVHQRIAWPELESDHTVRLEGTDEMTVRIGLRRAALAPDQRGGVLEITDGAGVRLLVPVGVKPRLAQGAPALADAAGLWVGNVVVDGVSEVRRDATTPVPTSSEFGFRVIVHVDADGQARLLRQVYQMWEAFDVDDSGGIDPNEGRYVLVSDDALLSHFEPAGLRDGEPTSYRVSSAAYDFVGDAFNGTAMTSTAGSFGPDGAPDANPLEFKFTLAASAETNPFRHAFHPDHDDVVGPADIDHDPTAPIDDGAPVPLPYDISRVWTLSFAATDPAGVHPPEWGDTLTGGVFRETVTGLHKHPITVQGSFRLWRLSDDPALNPGG